MEIEQIASMLSDDINSNNGLILEMYTDSQYNTIITALNYLEDDLIKQANLSDDEEITEKLKIMKELDSKIAASYMPVKLSIVERRMVLDALLLIKKHHPTVDELALDEALRMFSI